MGGPIGVIISILAATAFYGTGHPLLFWLSIADVVLCFWSWHMMHKQAMMFARAKRDRLRKDMILEGRTSEEITAIRPSSDDAFMVADGLTAINMFATFVGVVLLIWGIIVQFF
jgi:small-conductance mechanosensitive channel